MICLPHSSQTDLYEGRAAVITRFERKLYIGFAILVLLFTPILIGSFVVISELEMSQGDLLSKNAQDVIEAERLSALINQEFALVQAYVLRGQKDALDQLENVHRSFQSAAATLLLGIEVDESPALMTEMRQLEDQSYSSIKDGVALRSQGATIAEMNQYFEKSNLTRGARVLALVRENVALQSEQLHAARAHVDQTSRRLVIGLVLASGFALLATGGIILLLYQMIRNKAAEDRRRDEKLKLELDLSNARKEAVEVVAHDLKNPLSALKMSMELLEDELDDVSKMKAEVSMGFQIAGRSIQSMQRLIEDQLDHTKIESGQLTLDKSLTNITELLKDTEFRFRPLMESKVLTFVAKFDRSLFAEVDAPRIDQVLSNLLGNALKFTGSGGVVELSATRAGSTISILVRDNGPGISPEARSHIFERYWQVKETSKKGTGLGLSIAKGIAEAHGGSLKCNSEIGHGCEFEFLLLAAELIRPAEFTTH
jgi:signal transduction histidine kinase